MSVQRHRDIDVWTRQAKDRPALPLPQDERIKGVPEWDAYEHPPRGPGAGIGMVGARADIRTCVCGGEIVVSNTRPANGDDVMTAVQTHRATDQHWRWMRRQGGES